VAALSEWSTWALAGLVAAGFWALIAYLFPLVPCRVCKGKGKISAPMGRARRRCPWCAGFGWRPRASHLITGFLGGGGRSGVRKKKRR
jgi:hypothetical protein